MYFEHVCTESLHVTDTHAWFVHVHAYAYARMSSICRCSKQMTPTSGEGSRCRLTVNCAVMRYADYIFTYIVSVIYKRLYCAISKCSKHVL